MYSSCSSITTVPTIMMIETTNWKVISAFLKRDWETPAFNAPLSTATGLKEESTKAGYPPAITPVPSAMASRAGINHVDS